MKTNLFLLLLVICGITVAQSENATTYNVKLTQLSQNISSYSILNKIQQPTEEQSYQLKVLKVAIKRNAFEILETLKTEEELKDLLFLCDQFDAKFSALIAKKGNKILLQ